MSKKKGGDKEGLFDNPIVLLSILIVASILLFNSQPEISLFGKATAINFIGDIGGDWEMTEILLTDSRNEVAGQETIYIANINQANNDIKVYVEDSQFETRGEMNLEGILIENELNLKGSFEDGTGIAELIFTSIKVGKDCNTFSGTGSWKYKGGKEYCEGDVSLSGKRLDPIGCGRLPCNEKWECSEWGTCINGTQIRTCDDINECGTLKDKPEENRACTVPIDSERAVRPAPTFSYAMIGLVFVGLLLIAAIVYILIILINKKKRLASDLDYLIEKSYSSLNARDKFSALEFYRQLTEKFELYKGKIAKKDVERIYNEAVELHKEILKR